MSLVYNGILEAGQTGKYSNSALKEGADVVYLQNKSGTTIYKGMLVDASASFDYAVTIAAVGNLDITGVAIANVLSDQYGWFAYSGVIQVAYCEATTRGHFARMSISTDTGEFNGTAKSEALPTPPFYTDNHFREIGHCLQSQASSTTLPMGVGDVYYALTQLHFN